jgi:hypothetical protein
MKRFVKVVLMGIAGVLCAPGYTLADDAIVAAFGSKVAQAMCADGGAWLDAYKTPREQCSQISQSVLGPCMTKVLEGRSVPLKSEAELQQLSENLYACMKDAFVARYGSNAK